jgi:hypothetical protein
MIFVLQIAAGVFLGVVALFIACVVAASVLELT